MSLAARCVCLFGLLSQPFFPLCAELTEAPQRLTLHSVHIATGLWPGFTEPNQQGAYFELLKLVFPSETHFKVSYTSYNRSVQMVAQQQADMVLGIGLQDSPTLPHSALPFDLDKIVVLFKPARLHVKQSHDLANYTLATQRGYNYHMTLGINAQNYEVDDIATGVSLVRNDRVDAFLVEKTELQSQMDIEQLGDLSMVLLAGEPIYIGFANNERGKQLKAWWDQQFLHLYQSHQLQLFYQQYVDMELPEASFLFTTSND